MNFFKRLFGNSEAQASQKGNLIPLEPEVKRERLYSPTHPAYKLALEAAALSGEARVEIIDKALALCPQDVDLLYAKACSTSSDAERTRIIDELIKSHPSHFDAVMIKGKHFGYYKRPLPENWEYDFVDWSEKCTKLEGFMLERLRENKHAQIVYHCLTPTLAMVYGCADKSVCDNMKKMRWELRWAKTPYGNIAAHYVIWTDASNVSFKNEAFIPHAVSNPPSVRDGFCLLQRLAQSDHCFLVFSDGSGQVFHNELFVFPDSLKGTLRDVKTQLDKIGPGDARELVDKAVNWYMDNTDIKSIKF